MSDKETLEQTLAEIGRTRRTIMECPGRYAHGKALMNEAAEKVDANPKRALKLITDARESVEQEAKILRRLADIRRRRQNYPSYQPTDEENKAEAEIDALLSEGEYDMALARFKVLEEALTDDIDASVECDVSLALADAEISLGRGNTLVAKVVNGTKFPMRLLRLEGKSSQAQIIVFDEFRGVIAPGASRDVRVNVIPGIEGDIVVELEGVVEMSSRQVPLKRHASMRVTPVPVTVFIQPPIPQGQPLPVQNVPPAPTRPSDPLSLVEKGTVDEWATCVTTYFESRGAIPVEGLAQKPGYQTMDGYRSLFQALLLLDYARRNEWENWFDSQGFAGDEMTRRCSDLLFHMRSAPGQYELELDGNVGSSNNNYLVSALHIAAGTIILDREKRKEMSSWEISGTKGGRPFRLVVDRSVKKGENGARPRSIFKVTLG